MPYTASNVPAHVPASRRPQWAAVWNAAYAQYGSEERAFQIANGVAGPQAKASKLLTLLAPPTPPVAKGMGVPRASGGLLIHAPGGAVARTKAQKAPPGLVEGYVLTWGNPHDRDLEGEYFTPDTELCFDWFTERPALYHHGMDKTLGIKTIGAIKKYEPDNLGLWVQAQLRMQDDYARAVYGMTGTKDFGWSSGSVEHLVQIGPNGHIRRWPWIEGSITPAPAQPSKTTVFPAVKGLPQYNTGPKRLSLKAYQMLMGDDQEFRAYLKGLSLASGGHGPAGSAQTMTKETEMASMKQVIRAALRNAGVKLDDDELDAIAAETEDEIRAAEGSDDDEYAVMSDDDYEDDALMAFDDEDDAMMAFDDEDDAMMAEDDDDAFASYRAESLNLEEEIPVEAPDNVGVIPKSRRRKATRKNPRKAAYAFAVDEWDDSPPRRARKSADPVLNELQRLNSRIDRLARRPAPGESGVGRRTATKSGDLSVTRAWEDQPEVYAEAFKAYLVRGPARLFDEELRVLEAKGRAHLFAGGRTQYDPATKSLKVLNISNDSSVGYGVPPEWITELNKNIMSATVMAPECRTRTTSSDRILQPDLRTSDARRVHAANVSHPGETVASGAAHRATEFGLGQIQIPIHVVLISMASTLSALEDVAFDLEREISEAFTEAMAVYYDTAIPNGDGNGKLLGFLQNNDITGAASVGVQTVGGYVAAGDTASILSGDVIKTMLYHLPAPYRAKAKWYCNSNTLLELAKLKDGDGRYLWDEKGTGISGGMPEVLLGKPVVVDEFMPDIAANAFPLAFADLGTGYTIGQRVDFSIRRFDEVRADLDQALFIGRARVGGQATQPAAYKVLRMSAS